MSHKHDLHGSTPWLATMNEFEILCKEIKIPAKHVLAMQKNVADSGRILNYNEMEFELREALADAIIQQRRK